MTLPLYVKRKPWIFRLIPWFSSNMANTIYPNIYLPDKLFFDLQSKDPSPYSQATLVHEEVHLRNQKEMGIIRYGLRYGFSRRFRFEEELQAIKPQMILLRNKGIEFDKERRAQLLSGWEYLWCVSYADAKKRLDALL